MQVAITPFSILIYDVIIDTPGLSSQNILYLPWPWPQLSLLPLVFKHPFPSFFLESEYVNLIILTSWA